MNATMEYILGRKLVARTVCAACGKEAYEHHEFKPVTMPVGCLCSITDWRDKRNIPPVCAKFKGDGHYCTECDHDRKCHAI